MGEAVFFGFHRQMKMSLDKINKLSLEDKEQEDTSAPFPTLVGHRHLTLGIWGQIQLLRLRGHGRRIIRGSKVGKVAQITKHTQAFLYHVMALEIFLAKLW